MVQFTEVRGRERIPREISVWDLHFRADGSLVVGADADLYGCELPAEQIAALVQEKAVKVEEAARQGRVDLDERLALLGDEDP